MKGKTLLILAAGMGSRFGGLKQIEPVGENGEFIIDYSIYDAMKAGFNKVVFVIKEENYDEFKNTIGKRVSAHIPVEYCFQKIDNIPSSFNIPEDRVKPWGTGHAILAARDLIHEDFAIINADDFYGRDAYMEAASFIDNKKVTSKEEYANIGYEVVNTLTLNGSVKRGVCISDGDNLDALIESVIVKEDGIITCTPIDKSPSFTIRDEHLVSMNMFCFDDSIFKYLEEEFVNFFIKNQDDLSKCEYLLTDVVTSLINRDIANVSLLKTEAKWIGVTYREDKDGVVNSISELIKNKEYPFDLWSK